MENKKTKKVISENIKGTRKNLSKKKSISKKIIDAIKNHKIISISLLSLIIIILMTFYIINYISYSTRVLTINKIDYTQSDFMIYLYSAKYNYFGGNIEITEDDLNVIYDDDTKMTVGEYLKEVALSDIKTASAINLLAEKYGVILLDSDLEELENEKKKFIDDLGGKSNFKKFLKENNINEKSYDNMSKTDKLYKKIIENVFSDGKINDLSDEEIEKAKENYNSNYFKIKQIILTIINIDTGKSLNSTTINQKETLAKTIVNEAKSGTSFDELIKKYSEDAVDKEGPYEVYYKTGELLSELESVVLELKPGEVSNVIKTKYAYHVIQKQELDDAKLNEYYDDLREEKCIDEVKENIDSLQIVYHDAYEKIKIK